MKAFKPILVFEFRCGDDEDDSKMIQETMRNIGMTPSGLPASDRANLYREMTGTNRKLVHSDNMSSAFPALLQANAFFADRNVEILGIETIHRTEIDQEALDRLKELMKMALDETCADQDHRNELKEIAEFSCESSFRTWEGVRVFYRECD